MLDGQRPGDCGSPKQLGADVVIHETGTILQRHVFEIARIGTLMSILAHRSLDKGD
jgi:hypothetical protein